MAQPITLEQLSALDAIARTGSFAAAATALHKVQSAVSYGVRQMEQALGVPLFDRSGHRAVLTAAGQLVLEEARSVMRGVGRLESLATQFQQGFEPRLWMVVDGILPMQPILHTLKTLADEGVPTHVQVTVEYLHGVQETFERDRADIMLVKDWRPGPGLEAHPLPPVEVVLVAGAQHPLAQGRSNIPLHTLQQHVELTVHDTASSLQQGAAPMFGGTRVFYLGDFLTKRQALLMGVGFGWMPRYLVEEDLHAGRLAVVHARMGSRFSFSPALVHPASRPLGRTGQRLLDMLTAAPTKAASRVSRAKPKKRRA